MLPTIIHLAPHFQESPPFQDPPRFFFFFLYVQSGPETMGKLRDYDRLCRENCTVGNVR